MSAKMWLCIATVAVGTVTAAGVVTAFLLPRDFEITRTQQIYAPRDIVWDHVAVLENHAAWSPWQAKDPTTIIRFTGPEGVGRTMSWVGKVTGEGSEMITALEPKHRIDTHLDLADMGTAEAWLALEATAPDTTRVTWGLTGTNEGIFGGVISAMLDTVVGGDYEDGLRRLKAIAEATPLPVSQPLPSTEPLPVEAAEDGEAG